MNYFQKDEVLQQIERSIIKRRNQEIKDGGLLAIPTAICYVLAAALAYSGLLWPTVAALAGAGTFIYVRQKCKKFCSNKVELLEKTKNKINRGEQILECDDIEKYREKKRKTTNRRMTGSLLSIYAVLLTIAFAGYSPLIFGLVALEMLGVNRLFDKAHESDLELLETDLQLSCDDIVKANSEAVTGGKGSNKKSKRKRHLFGKEKTSGGNAVKEHDGKAKAETGANHATENGANNYQPEETPNIVESAVDDYIRNLAENNSSPSNPIEDILAGHKDNKK